MVLKRKRFMAKAFVGFTDQPPHDHISRLCWTIHPFQVMKNDGKFHDVTAASKLQFCGFSSRDKWMLAPAERDEYTGFFNTPREDREVYLTARVVRIYPQSEVKSNFPKT